MDLKCGESGEFVPTVTPDRVRAVLETVDGPAITTSDVASKLDYTAAAAPRTLDGLHDG